MLEDDDDCSHKFSSISRQRILIIVNPSLPHFFPYLAVGYANEVDLTWEAKKEVPGIWGTHTHTHGICMKKERRKKITTMTTVMMMRKSTQFSSSSSRWKIHNSPLDYGMDTFSVSRPFCHHRSQKVNTQDNASGGGHDMSMN
jgi:hypothetical protein